MGQRFREDKCYIIAGLYHKSHFLFVDFPKAVKKKLLALDSPTFLTNLKRGFFNTLLVPVIVDSRSIPRGGFLQIMLKAGRTFLAKRSICSIRSG